MMATDGCCAQSQIKANRNRRQGQVKNQMKNVGSVPSENKGMGQGKQKGRQNG